MSSLSNPIFLAAQRGAASIVARLLDSGCSPSAVDEQGRTPLHWAAAGGSAACVELLLPLSDPAARSGSRGQTPLMIAAAHGHLSAVELLLERGDPHAVDREGSRALAMAAGGGHLSCVKEILRARPAHSQFELDQALFACACNATHAGCAGALVEAGANPQARCRKAASEGCVPIPPNSHGIGDGATPLMAACSAGHGNVARELLAWCNPKALDDHGRDALMAAAGAHARDAGLVHMLLPLCDSTRSDDQGLDAAAWAQRAGDPAISALLRAHARALGAMSRMTQPRSEPVAARQFA